MNTDFEHFCNKMWQTSLSKRVELAENLYRLSSELNPTYERFIKARIAEFLIAEYNQDLIHLDGAGYDFISKEKKYRVSLKIQKTPFILDEKDISNDIQLKNTRGKQLTSTSIEDLKFDILLLVQISEKHPTVMMAIHIDDINIETEIIATGDQLILNVDKRKLTPIYRFNFKYKPSIELNLSNEYDEWLQNSIIPKLKISARKTVNRVG